MCHHRLLLKYPTIPLFFILFVTIFGNTSFIESYVNTLLLCFLVDFGCHSQWGRFIWGPDVEVEVELLQAIAFQLWYLFMSFYKVAFFAICSVHLPLFIKVPLYKAFFLLLLLPLPLVVALSFSTNEEEEQIEEEESEVYDDNEEDQEEYEEEEQAEEENEKNEDENEDHEEDEKEERE